MPQTPRRRTRRAANTRREIGMAGEEAADVKLIGSWWSPYTMRPRIALNMKKVDYEFLEETFGTKSELLLKTNPVYKKIPVLLHGNYAVCESMIIVEYIDAVWSGGDHGPAILPPNPYDQAVARFWVEYIVDKWYPSLLGVGKAQTDDTRAAFIEQLLMATQLLEDAFETCSKGKSFFGGDSVGYLDIALGCYLGILRATEEVFGIKFFDKAETPLLAAWAERFCAEEAVGGLVPETAKLVEFSKPIAEKWKEEVTARPS